MNFTDCRKTQGCESNDSHQSEVKYSKFLSKLSAILSNGN